VPTIAVATDGGVSVIKGDGAVVDLTKLISGSVNASRVVFLDDGGIAWSSRDVNRYIQVLNAIPDADYAGDPDRLYSEGDQSAPGTDLHLLNLYAASHLVNGACAGNDGITFFAERPDAPERGMVAYTTSTYNTGWMTGDIKGAFLSDTDDTDLVGSGELVTNGDAGTGDTSGWAAAAGLTATIVSGAFKLENTSGGRTFSQPLTLVAGTPYVATVDVTVAAAGSTSIILGTAVNSSAGGGNVGISTVGKYQVTFTPTQSSVFLTVSIGDTTGQGVTVDNISVKLADVDRSVNNKGLIVNGTVTRTPVATGADLVAYSGLSASNYLEQPYNPDLDFGTGDFCVMGWVKQNGSAVGSIFDRAIPAKTGALFEFRTGAGGLIVFYTQDASSAFSYLVSSINAISYGVWSHLSAIRRSGTLEMRVNGLLTTNTAALNSTVARNISNSSAGLNVGLRRDATNPFNGSLALIRVSATAPTADQIAKIYNDEKFLFQDGRRPLCSGHLTL